MHSAIIRGDYKLFRFYERPDELYLYNLRRDIGERNNVAREETERAHAMNMEMKRYFDTIEACLPKVNPDADPSYSPYDPDADPPPERDR